MKLKKSFLNFMQLSELIQNHMFSRKDAKFWKMIQGGRGNVAHLYVFQQESKGNRVFSKRGRKIY